MSGRHFGIRYWILASGTGAVLTIALFLSVGSATASSAVRAFLWPGAAAAHLIGYGSHDLEGWLLYILINFIFYCCLCLILFRLLGIGSDQRG
jgi:hypothetical protein